MDNIIFDDTLDRLTDPKFSDLLCHAYCHEGTCTFERNGSRVRFEQGNCMIITGRGNLVHDLHTSDDFRVEVIYVTPQFIEFSTPASNYGTRGHFSLFQNPVMRLTEEQQQLCRQNFAAVRRRLEQTDHLFRRDALRNAVECMIIDFFDFHAHLYGNDKVSTQSHQLMEQFIDLLEQGLFRKNRDIGYYADRLCVTPKYLSEVSKKVSGMPVGYWITRYTALDISRLLRDRSLSLTAISDLFGFSSQSHFNRFVMANLGDTPGNLRQ